MPYYVPCVCEEQFARQGLANSCYVVARRIKSSQIELSHHHLNFHCEFAPLLHGAQALLSSHAR